MICDCQNDDSCFTVTSVYNGKAAFVKMLVLLLYCNGYQGWEYSVQRPYRDVPSAWVAKSASLVYE